MSSSKQPSKSLTNMETVSGDQGETLTELYSTLSSISSPAVMNWASSDHLSASTKLTLSEEEKKSPVMSTFLTLMEGQVEKLLSNKSDSRSGVVHVEWQPSGLALEDYPINRDEEPLIVNKTVSGEPINYVQEIGLRYLRPPTPPTAGEIIITKVADEVAQPAPPLIIRQLPARPSSPEPLVIRERPPTPPTQIGRTHVTISGKRASPVPRKVVVERLAELPSKPQPVIIERWLPYKQQKRRVLYYSAPQKQSGAVNLTPKNVIVQWRTPGSSVTPRITHLGEVMADPVAYVERYGPDLVEPSDLPLLVNSIEKLGGNRKAKAEPERRELTRELESFDFGDLEKEGMRVLRVKVDYEPYTSDDADSEEVEEDRDKRQLQKGGATAQPELEALLEELNRREPITASSPIQPADTAVVTGNWTGEEALIIDQIFSYLDVHRTGRVGVNEAISIILRLNSKLDGGSAGEKEFNRRVAKAAANLSSSNSNSSSGSDRSGVGEINNDKQIDLNEFKAKFMSI